MEIILFDDMNQLIDRYIDKEFGYVPNIGEQVIVNGESYFIIDKIYNFDEGVTQLKVFKCGGH